MIAFRGLKKVGPRPDWSPFRGLIQTFRRASPPLSYGSPPRGGGGVKILQKSIFKPLSDFIRQSNCAF